MSDRDYAKLHKWLEAAAEEMTDSNAHDAAAAIYVCVDAMKNPPKSKAELVKRMFRGVLD